MEEVIELIIKYGYIILFLYSLGGGFVAMVGAGILAGLGRLDLWVCLLVGLSANFLGDCILYYLVRTQRSTLSIIINKARRKIALVRLWMRKFGAFLMLFQKFIYGLKTLVPLAAGMSGYNIKKFMLYNAVGSVLWALCFGFGGFALSEPIKAIFEAFGQYSFIAPIFLLVLVLGLYIWISRISERKILSRIKSDFIKSK